MNLFQDLEAMGRYFDNLIVTPTPGCGERAAKHFTRLEAHELMYLAHRIDLIRAAVSRATGVKEIMPGVVGQ